MLLRKLIITLYLLAGLALAGCGPREAESVPEPLPTQVIAQEPTAVPNRPTLPPTFTPSPTLSPTPSTTPTVPPTPTATYTLTFTPPPSPTPSWTPRPTITNTWTPNPFFNTPVPTDDFDTEEPGEGTPSATPDDDATTSAAGECSPGAGGENLLLNPGFEGGTHSQEVDSVQVPDDWGATWRPEGDPVEYDPENNDGYFRPDMLAIRGDTPPFDDPPRVRSGEQAIYIHGSNKVFDAALLQTVVVVEGSDLCFSGYGQAWSQHQSEDRTQSRLDTEDDRDNMNFQLGIDPTGGTDPEAQTVQWGELEHLYDIYDLIPPVRVTAEAPQVTVFVRVYTMWRFDHNDIFLDDMRLAVLDGG